MYTFYTQGRHTVKHISRSQEGALDLTASMKPKVKGVGKGYADVRWAWPGEASEPRGEACWADVSFVIGMGGPNDTQACLQPVIILSQPFLRLELQDTLQRLM